MFSDIPTGELILWIAFICLAIYGLIALTIDLANMLDQWLYVRRNKNDSGLL